MIHPDETQLQEYACEEPAVSSNSIAAHVKDCETCAAKVRLYRSLKVALQSSPLPLIDADFLYSQIKPRLKAYKPVDYKIPWLFALFIFFLGYLLFWTPDPGLRFNLPPVLILVITCLLGFFVLEYRYTRTNYIRKRNTF